MNKDLFIEVKNVSRFYERNQEKFVGVSDVNFKVRKGDIVALVGPSGCGKTTILRMLADLIYPDSGFITYNNQSTSLARQNGLLGYVPQVSSLIPFRNVIKNIQLPMEIRGVVDLKALDTLVKLCSLEGFESYFPAQLSGGMKQRVAIARALSINPEVLLLDEPFASLDEMAKERLNEEVLRVQEKLKTTIIYVTHNIEEAVFLANKIVILSKAPGTVVSEVEINLPRNRDARLRLSSDFFREVVKVRTLLKNI